MAKITPRDKDQAKWYQEVVRQADLADYGPVRGTIIYKPYGFAIWERIQRGLDQMIKAAGVDNTYFPLFIPYSFLKKEREHVEGFSPELALVTHGGGKKLDEPLVVRPTSETIMYDAFARWIQSYRDLPLKVNQWNNVVRWEKRTLPFIRGLEFLWQEGHTAHATQAEADQEVRRALQMYHDFIQDRLALYAVMGYKTQAEKFAGADYTTTVEVLLKDGKALQSGTSHMLGQNFAKSFDIKFLDKAGRLEYVWQTSWGLSTRIIGALILAHGDDKGLRLPPQIAPTQVVVVPITTSDGQNQAILNRARQVADQLAQAGIRVKLDLSDKTPGFKFNHWELKGVPVRVEIGTKEAKEGYLTVFRRDLNRREKLESTPSAVKKLLADIQTNLYQQHLEYVKTHTVTVDNWEQFQQAVKQGGFVKVYYKDDPKIEAMIKEKTKATARCVPFDSYDQTGTCFYTRQKGAKITLFAKAY